MTSIPGATRVTESRMARLATDGLDPKNWILADVIAVGWNADRLTGIGWGLLGGLFAAVIPILFINFGIRRGRWADRHVGQRRQRLIVMAFILGSVVCGITLLTTLGAPRTVIALIAAMLTTLGSLFAVTAGTKDDGRRQYLGSSWRGKISVHAAVASGSVVMLSLCYGPWALLAYLLVGMVGWSRIELYDHTRGQVAAGALLGAVVAGSTFVFLR
ncbi:phosphatase PAP2 family protein [Streptomyces sp. NPDC021100]|uniref:phosphatase PAP2 family protein n=1 Tax=Streptomyces sp. NPDC021100 TaxID=3365114 RepID=UPI0037905FBA